MDLSFLESDPNLPPPAYTDVIFPQEEEAEQQRSDSVPTESGSRLQNYWIWIQRCRFYLRSLIRRKRGVLTPGSAERGNPLEDLASDDPSDTTITPPPTAVTPAWGSAKAFVDQCKAWGEGLEERLRDAVRSEALAKREAAEAREKAAEAREEVAAAREKEEAANRGKEDALRQLRAEVAAAREKEEEANRGKEEALRQLRAEVAAVREKEEAANRGKEEALSQLRAEVDESIKQRKLWLNKENELLGRIRDLELVANS